MDKEQVKYGKYTTPLRYVALASEWLRDYVDEKYIILDSSCGNGVFFASVWDFPNNRYLGFDIDDEVIRECRRKFPFVEFHQRNSLANISRESYLIHPQSKLCIVGNPPYNDRTSAVKRKVKEKFDWVDTDVKRRDIGLSFLNSYYKIDADVVVVIHPLSYLIKKTNRLGASVFYGNYSLERHIIFSSHRFEGTVGSNPFPVIMALYVKNRKGVGDVGEIVFETEEGDRFKLSNWDYIGNHISKYPGKERYNPEILFWTMRDINALKRNKTFITTRSNSAVDVDPHKLGYYCYVDLFKRYASVPYWMGNFDVPLPKDGIGYEHLLFFEHVGKKLNPAIFGDTGQPTAEEIDEVKQYINQVVGNG